MIGDTETKYMGSDRKNIASIGLMIPFESFLIGEIV